MPLTETESQTTHARFEGDLPDGAKLEITITVNTGANTAGMQLRLNGSAGMQGIVNDLKTIRNRLIAKYNLTP